MATTATEDSLPSKALYMDFNEAMRRIESLCDVIRCLSDEGLKEMLEQIGDLAELGKAIAEDQRLYQEKVELDESKEKWRGEECLAALAVHWGCNLSSITPNGGSHARTQQRKER